MLFSCPLAPKGKLVSSELCSYSKCYRCLRPWKILWPTLVLVGNYYKTVHQRSRESSVVDESIENFSIQLSSCKGSLSYGGSNQCARAGKRNSAIVGLKPIVLRIDNM